MLYVAECFDGHVSEQFFCSHVSMHSVRRTTDDARTTQGAET